MGIENESGYKLQRDIMGDFPGSPASNSYTPMIYSRGQQMRAFEFSQEFYDPTPDSTGTHWVAE